MLVAARVHDGERTDPIRSNPPAKNLFSWTTAANILWIEQPVGTGFSTGTPTALDETDVAEQFSGFLANFFKTFPELVGKKLWIAGGECSEGGPPTSKIQPNAESFRIKRATRGCTVSGRRGARYGTIS